MGNGPGGGVVLGEAVLDGERTEERLHGAIAFGFATAKECVQLIEVAGAGTGVVDRRWTALTVLSASGFSLPQAGMQKWGSKA